MPQKKIKEKTIRNFSAPILCLLAMCSVFIFGATFNRTEDGKVVFEAILDLSALCISAYAAFLAKKALEMWRTQLFYGEEIKWDTSFLQNLREFKSDFENAHFLTKLKTDIIRASYCSARNTTLSSEKKYHNSKHLRALLGELPEYQPKLDCLTFKGSSDSSESDRDSEKQNIHALQEISMEFSVKLGLLKQRLCGDEMQNCKELIELMDSDVRERFESEYRKLVKFYEHKISQYG